MKKKIILFLLIITLFLPKVYASVCEEGSYKVEYNANGGKGAASATCVSSTLSNIKPTRSGYKFLGWSDKKSSTTVLYTPGQEVTLTSDITLYAVWSKGYKLTLNANGGSVSKKSITIYPGLTYGSLVTPTRKGYKFLGWYTKTSGGDNITSSTQVTKTKAHTIYAQWKKIKYTITYELNGGTNNSSNKTSYNVTTATFSLKKPTKKGYTFSGWYKDSKFKTKITKITKGTTGNKTLYAKWTPIKYTIQFYGNGNTSGSTKKQTSLKYNKTYTLNANGFKKKDFVFDSWNTKKDGSGKSYSNKESIKNLTASNGKVIKLYAIWKRKEYNIYYELNGGVNPTDAYTKYTKVSTITLKSPVRTGYTFIGWYTESTFKTKVTKIEKGTTGNKTFYAKWTPITYTIEYNLNNGINPNDAITSYTVNDEVILPKPTREGYKFTGWYKDSNLTQKIESVDLENPENLILYAGWENLISYTIEYYLDGGSNPSNARTTYTTDIEYVLPIPTKKGYKFIGWYTESTFENKVTSIPVGSTGNKTFYAKWEINNYSITYELNGGINTNEITLTYTVNDEVVLPLPERNGCTFVGWYTESTFENKVTSIPVGSTGDKVFYAKWNLLTYTIDYHLNGGENPNDVVLEYNVEDEVILKSPSRVGYKFLGWFTESTFENKVTTISKGSTGNKEFYAKWEELVVYTITYNLNGGANPENIPTTYTEIDEVVLPIPTRERYVFAGWYTESTLENKLSKIEVGTTGNLNLYARWEDLPTYTITYVLNGGINPINAVTTYTELDEVVLPIPTKEGYDFIGWYTESTFKNKVDSIIEGSTENKTFYAKWLLKPLVRTYNYVFYNNNYDDTLTSKNDMINTLYNIMNEGKTEYELTCGYSSVSDCFNDFYDLMQDQDLMKSISDYVNPYNNFQRMTYSRWTYEEEGGIKVIIEYSYSDMEHEAIDDKIDEIINEYNLDSLSNENKVRTIHDYIVNHNVYDIEAANANSYVDYDYAFKATGALLEGKAVCQGYSDAIALILDRYNIPNLKVSSDTHTWNLVYINGKWLHLDATWDDPIYPDGHQVLLTTYYLVTTAQLASLDTSAHTFNQNNYLETK